MNGFWSAAILCASARDLPDPYEPRTTYYNGSWDGGRQAFGTG